ncbi:MAG TPA: 50S ribosomal protein L25, partial [Desulfatiglandales bacterium]|nr:50S ribosomal protein L25 [Desulfatiglandales bacterium]
DTIFRRKRMPQLSLAARVRSDTGKGAARKLRRSDQVPAIFYGPNAQPVMLAVKYLDLKTLLKSASSENVIFQLQIESGQGSSNKTVMLKELQADPIKPVYYHADFYEISMDKELTLNVPVHLVGTPAGASKGGILQHVKRDLSVACLPGNLVEFLEVDVTALDIGDAVHVKDLVLPTGMKTAEDADTTIAVVTAPHVVAEKVEEVVEGEEKAEEAAAEEPKEEPAE